MDKPPSSKLVVEAGARPPATTISPAHGHRPLPSRRRPPGTAILPTEIDVATHRTPRWPPPRRYRPAPPAICIGVPPPQASRAWAAATVPAKDTVHGLGTVKLGEKIEYVHPLCVANKNQFGRIFPALRTHDCFLCLMLVKF